MGSARVIAGRGIHLPTVAWLILMPSLSSSPWMRGAPHNGLTLLIRRIKARISVPVLGRPGRRDRQRQCRRKPLRCHWTTVAGLTNIIASITCGQIRYSHTHSSRSRDESWRSPGPLSAQDGQLMLQGNQLKFQRGAAAKTEGEDRNSGGENRHHAVTVRLARENLQCFSALWGFEQGQRKSNTDRCCYFYGGETSIGGNARNGTAFSALAPS
jgi:hypothetical protein